MKNKKRINYSKKLRYEKERRKQKTLAEERISGLFNLADEMIEKDKNLAKRYVQLARKISMKYKSRIPSEYKRKFCKKCGSYLKQGKNVTVRLHNSKLIYHCQECGAISRFAYKSKRKKAEEKEETTETDQEEKPII
ncbi:MAG: ribonuclease P protein component 4 [Nanoarchaeota archaeon]|nr:ribonuclease P protein component 4 [Nanoarchaeota archaeon]